MGSEVPDERKGAGRCRAHAEMVEQGKIEADLDCIEELQSCLPSIGQFSVKGAVRWAEHVQERARRRRVRGTLNDVLQKTPGSGRFGGQDHV